MTSNVETNSSSNLTGVNILETHNAPNSASNRFTREEKQVLFQLFVENEDIIDIKHRKSCPKKHISIRDCWNKITDEFNSHPNTSTVRSLKQIQKFWLNARLRKSYPGNNAGVNSNASSSNENLRRLSTTESNNSVTIKNNIQNTSLTNSSSAISPPKLIRLSSQPLKIKNSPRYENIKFEKECDSEVIEMVSAEEEEEEEEDLTQEVEISTSSNDVNMVESEAHQYSIDHISAEKLTLNDLLEFKNGRSRDEIVLQIRTADPISSNSTINNQMKELNSNQSSYTTSYRIAHPANQATTLLQDHTFQQNQPQNQSQHINLSGQTLTQKNLHSPQNSLSSPNFFATNNQNNNFRAYEGIEDKISYYQLKEAELRFKEGQLKLEKMKIELQKSKDELKNIKELHAFKIKEMEIKLRILAEEDRLIRTNARK